MKGMVTDIERYAINDGFGLRTTVFLKGCPLRCRWCSNPETQNFYSEMVLFQDKCIGCGACRDRCPYGALDKSLLADRSICELCHDRENAFPCTGKCYPKCRKVVGEDKTVDEIVDVVKRDFLFYQLSGGGVTVSGGEPLAQPEFTLELLKSLRAHWLDTAIETCGAGRTEDYEKIAPYLNFAFIDCKHVDAKKLCDWTGGDAEQILNNLKRMDQLAGECGFELLIRTPVIPGFNDTAEDITQIARFISSNCKNYKGMELLPYHRLGRGKYTSLGRTYELTDLKSPDDKRMMRLNQILNANHIPVYQF